MLHLKHVFAEDKYSKLCANCKNPSKCNENDQFWGRQGSLQCLSDCFGDISWARLYDVKVHFNVNIFIIIMFIFNSNSSNLINLKS